MAEVSSSKDSVRLNGTVRKACIIGAGSSGIAACKTLHERGIPYDCFELGSGIGGMWRYQNDNGLSSAYRSLHINTSRDTMAYSDFPLPRDWPPFPDHGKVLQYFESYVDHFGFRDTITFRTKVEQVTAVGNGDWDVTVVGPDGQRRTNRYGAVLVANGHHWNPRLPNFPGEFHGQQLHSHDYREPGMFVGKRVLAARCSRHSEIHVWVADGHDPAAVHLEVAAVVGHSSDLRRGFVVGSREHVVVRHSGT